MNSVRSISDFNRKTIGAIFGTLIGIAISWGLAGGWDWLYLIGIPINIDFKSGIFAMSMGAIIGWTNGLLIAWPRTMSSPAGWKIIGFLMGLYALLFIFAVSQRFSEVEDIFLVAWLALTPAVVLIRISISLVERATFYHSDILSLRVLIIGICVLTSAVMATWPLDYLNELVTGRRDILNKAAEISHEMDWNVIHYEILSDKFSSLLYGFFGEEYHQPIMVRLVFADGRSIDCTLEGENSMYCPNPGIVP
ncbi:MAG: hypothetical protein KAV87_13165 [Desulfobacteraceae bacterium]|nr:hypothetical protein [Desulfobacteraceae bacterium]